ncbi:hypothetical protein [Crocosphaera chwakensis]|uniref:Uncharacterized protein n=1 Tax=Crocosphaera chwakensis CCY0110 TaxID=391612 RepID=A3IYP9_9CHRO|nr:hypothetical protein [Crocosphaera chwakensis]EAZ88402.1 hypothetical protein CY0110_05022 [Crocosphaera chwakensis CCY0110]
MSRLSDYVKKLRQGGINLIHPRSTHPDIPHIFHKVNKQISQLIAKTWLDGTELTEQDIRKLLEDEGLISKDEPLKVVIDKEPYSKWDYKHSPPGSPPTHNYEGHWNLLDEPDLPIEMYIPYPPRPPETDVSSEELQHWLAENPKVGPYYPENVWIPFSC